MILATRTDRAIALSAALVTAWLAATVAPMLSYAVTSRQHLPLVVHLLALALAAGTLLASTRGVRAVALLLDWLPLVLGPLLYIELRWLIAGVGHRHGDVSVMRWELALFPTNPSATWAPGAPSLLLSELLHGAYLSYYALILVPPLVLYLRGRREAFAQAMLALTMVYGVCFALYLVFPVDGPRFLMGPAAAPEGTLRSMTLALLAHGSSRGTAFPSSHVAAAVVSSLCALTMQPRTGAVIATLTLLLAAGTVYGGFHYAIDALAGVVTGMTAWLAAGVVWRALPHDGSQRATAS